MQNQLFTPSLENIFAREFFLNSGDGIVIAFSLATGLRAANVPVNQFLVISLMIVFIAGTILGLGAYFAGKIEIKHFYTEMEPAYQQKEDEKEIRLLENIGLGTRFQSMALEEIAKDRLHWEQLLKDLDADQLPPDLKAPVKRGVLSGLSFIIGGLLPLIPFIFTGAKLWLISVIITLCALPIAGYMKNKLTGGTLVGGIISAVLTGLMAGLGAYYVAGVFS